MEKTQYRWGHVFSLQTCVFHGTAILLITVGSIAMMSDAFTTRTRWIEKMIIDLMDPSNYNNNSIKEAFLANMYRIVSKRSCQKKKLFMRF